jgi:tetratricopeptide (TPR) repeat protein
MRLLIIAAAILVYLTSFRGAFLFDDEDAIINNPHCRSLWPLQDAMSARTQSPAAGRPVVALSLAFNYALGGLDPWTYHAFNLAIHVLAGLTLFGVIHRTLGSPHLRDQCGPSARPIAAVASLLWLIHPLQTESVTYIIQRAESLVGLFYLLTLYCAVRGFLAGRPKPWFLLAVLACILGMASKEVMATVPLVVLLYDRTFWVRSFREILSRRTGFYTGLAATWLVLLFLVRSGPRSDTAGFGLEYLSPLEYAASQPGVILHYLRLCLWPHPLCLDYAWPVASTPAEVMLPGVVIAVLLLAVAWSLKRWSPAGFLGAWFFIALAPSSSIVPIRDLAFEHRMYLPLAAVVTLAVVIGQRLLLPTSASRSNRLRRTLAVALAVVVAVPLGYATSRRNLDYADVETMWRTIAANRPWNPRAHCGVAAALAARGDLAGARAGYQTALGIDPLDPITHNNLGGVLANLGRYDEAVDHFAEAVRLNPRFVVAQTSLGNALRLKGDLEGAVAAHRKAIEIDPTWADARYNLGLDLEVQGDEAAAADAFSAALRLNPSHKGAQAAIRAAATRPTGP